MNLFRKFLLCFLAVICLTSCQNMRQSKLNRQMKRVARTYLKQEEIADYEKISVTAVDTLTEFGYAKLNSELLNDMEVYYRELYCDASDDTNRREVVGLYLNEIMRTRADFEDLIDNGDLETAGVVLFMVTGNYLKDGENQQFVFLVNPDKKTLHNLDPFGDNLLYKDEE